MAFAASVYDKRVLSTVSFPEEKVKTKNRARSLSAREHRSFSAIAINYFK